MRTSSLTLDIKTFALVAREDLGLHPARHTDGVADVAVKFPIFSAVVGCTNIASWKADVRTSEPT